MTRTTAEAIAEIEAYVERGKCGWQPYGWYVGITDNPRRRLREHKVGRFCWVAVPTPSADAARAVELYFLAKGYTGGEGGGGQESRHVYAYKITDATKEM